MSKDKMSSSKRLKLIVILGSLAALGPLSIDMYLPSLPTIADHLNASGSMVQLSITFFLIGLAVGQLVAGPLSDAKGRRGVLIAGMAAYTAASFLVAAADSIWMLILCRLIQGAAGASGIVISRAIVRDHYAGAELTKFFALLTLVSGAGPIVAPIMGGLLILYLPWQGIFVVLAVIGAVLTITVYYAVPESLQPESRITGGFKTSISAMLRLLGDKEFLGTMGTQGFTSGVLFAYIAGSPFLMQKVYGVSPQTFSLLFAINGLGFLLSTQVAARFAVRFGEKRMLFAGVMLNAAASLSFLAVLLLEGTLVQAVLPLFLIVSSVGMINTTATALALQKHAKAAGSAASWLGLASMLAGSAASPLVGLGGEQSSLAMGVVICGCSLAAITCFIVFVRRNQSTGNIASSGTIM